MCVRCFCQLSLQPGNWRCVTIKLIDRVIIYCRCSSLSRSRAPTERHRRVNNHPATLRVPLRHDASRVLIKRRSRSLSGFTSVFPHTAPLDLYSQLSVLITCVRPVQAVKLCFVGSVRHVDSHCAAAWRSACMCTGTVRQLELKVTVTLLEFLQCVEWNPKTSPILPYSYLLFPSCSLSSCPGSSGTAVPAARRLIPAAGDPSLHFLYPSCAAFSSFLFLGHLYLL